MHIIYGIRTRTLIYSFFFFYLIVSYFLFQHIDLGLSYYLFFYLYPLLSFHLFMDEFRIFFHLGFTYTTYITVKGEFLKYFDSKNKG